MTTRGIARNAWVNRWALLSGVILATAATGLARWLHEWPVHHFGVVVPGAVYRGGQPRGEQWHRLAEHYGIRAVIDLREDRPRADWQIEEVSFCARAGVRYVKVPIGPDHLTEEELDNIMTVMTDPSCQPLLVHCEHGSSRTGVVIAAYRMVVQGWGLEAALKDSYRYRRPMNPGYTAYLKQLAAEEGRGPTLASHKHGAAGHGIMRDQAHGE